MITVVVTGGPCSGKTSAMDALRARFDAEGIPAVFVAEAGTDLILRGESPANLGSMLPFQSRVMALQLKREAEARRQAKAIERSGGGNTDGGDGADAGGHAAGGDAEDAGGHEISGNAANADRHAVDADGHADSGNAADANGHAHSEDVVGSNDAGVHAMGACDSTNKQVLVVCDRGISDGAAYLNEQEYAQVLTENGLDATSALLRYDAVYCLESTAKANDDTYTTANNTARSETREEASVVDDRTQAAWSGHPRYTFIANEKAFASKAQKLADAIVALYRELNSLS